MNNYRYLINKKLNIIFFLIVFVSCNLNKNIEYNKISNNNISWDCDYLGLSCKVIGKAENSIIQSKTVDLNKLLLLFDDPNKWVVAHVILSKRKFGTIYGESASVWNGLQVEITSQNKVHYNEQQLALKEFWRKFLITSNNNEKDCMLAKPSLQ